MKLRLSLIFVLLLAVFSCSRPSSYEEFVAIEDKQDGMYAFTADMTDSLSCYDISFYTRIDGKTKPVSFPLDIRWVSPEGKEFGERAWICPGAEGVRVSQSFLSRQILAPYRAGTVPETAGVWTLKVATDVPGMRGLGMILTWKSL